MKTSSNNGTNTRKRKRRFRISGIRWDKIIGIITIIAIIVCTCIIVKDAKAGNSIKTANDNILAESITESTSGYITQTTAKEKIVCIDAGHGGTDGGAEYGGKVEKDQTLVIAKLVQQYIEAAGIKVVMTRTDDETVSLYNRVDICNNANSSVMVSIHRNYYENGTSAKGVEAWILNSSPKDSKSLAGNILTSLEKVSGVTNRGIKTGTMAKANTNYYINSSSNCPSCIIELGFITNSSDTELVTTNKEKCANAIAQGIITYLNNN